jgi:hypothetical protein
MLAATNHSVMTAIGITAFASISTEAGIPAIASHRGMARLRSDPMLAVAANSAAAKALNVTRLLTKLDLRDRAQAVVFAYETGFVQPGVPE